MCRRSRKFCAKLRLGRTNTPRTGKNFRFIQIFSCSERRNFALSHQTSLFQKTAFCSHKNKFLPNAPFPETHNLLSTQIKVCLYINTHKSLRSKTAVSHRFKILRAILHKTAIFYKDFLKAHSLRFSKNFHARNFEPRSQGKADSLKHGRLVRVRSQYSLFRRSPTRQNLPPQLLTRPSSCFLVLFAEAKRT